LSIVTVAYSSIPVNLLTRGEPTVSTYLRNQVSRRNRHVSVIPPMFNWSGFYIGGNGGWGLIAGT
jgi:hypothetical protein